MRNIYSILFISAFFLLSTSCRVKKSDKSTYNIKETQTKNVAATLISDKETNAQWGSKSEVERSGSEQQMESSEETTESWKEINYYDTEGNLRKTVKEGTVRNKKIDTLLNRKGNTRQSDSIISDTSIKENTDFASISSFYNSMDIDRDSQSDSRLIQGVEWFYVLGISLLFGGMVIFFFKKK